MYIRGRPYSAHAARGGGGVYKKRADACRGRGGGLQPLVRTQRAFKRPLIPTKVFG